MFGSEACASPPRHAFANDARTDGTGERLDGRPATGHVVPCCEKRIKQPGATIRRATGGKLPTYERPEISYSRIPRQRPGAGASGGGASGATAAGSRARRTGGCATDLPRRAQEHQHARFSGGRSVFALRGRRCRGRRTVESVPAVRNRPPHVRAVHVIRPEQPIRVHAADPGAGVAQERAQ